MQVARLLTCLLILIVTMNLSSCSSPISHDRDETILVPAGATVAFAPGVYEGRANVDPTVANDIVHRRIDAAIINQLQAKGFKLVDDPQTADFVVSYIVRIRQSTRQVATTSGMSHSSSPWGPGWGTGVTTVQQVNVSNAAIIVDMIQRSTGHTAWRGVWQGSPGNRAPTQQEVENMMRRLFATAPAAG